MVYYTTILVIGSLCMILSGISNIGVIKNIFTFILVLALALLSGTRYQLGGYDYRNYEYMFQLAPTLNNFNVADYIKAHGLIGSDIGWTLINSVTKSLGFNFYGLTVIVAFFFWFSLYFVLKGYVQNLNIFVVIAVYKYLLDVSFIYMRQSVAVALFAISLNFILKRKILPYMLIILFAATIHFSAIILFPIYWINKIKITKTRLEWYTFIFSMSFILVILHVDISSLFSVFSHFISGSGSQKVSEAAAGNLYGDTNIISSVLHLVEFLIVDIFLIKKFNVVDLNNDKQTLMIKLFMLLLPIYSIFAGSPIMVRYGFYFIFTYIVIIDLLISKINLTKKIFVFVLLSLISFAGMYKFVISFDDGADYQYDSFIFHDISIRN